MESIHKKVDFPCRYNKEGCSYVSTNIEQHEDECRYNSTRCCPSIMSQCTWRGSFNAMPAHVERAHSDFFDKHVQQDTLTIPFHLLSDINEWFFKNGTGDLFQVILMDDDNFANLRVKYIGCEGFDDRHPYYYKLKIVDHDKMNIWTIEEKCDSIREVTVPLDSNKGFSIPYKHLHQISDSCQIVIITIIFKPRLKSCTIPIIGFCKYDTEGCKVVSAHIEEHEQQCKYNTTRCCPLATEPCDWKGNFFQMPAHIIKQHNLFITISPNQDITEYFNSFLQHGLFTKEWFLKIDSHLIQVVLKSEIDVAKFIVQFIGWHEDSRAYNYKLDINNYRTIWTVTGRCQAVENVTTAFNANKGFSISYISLMKFSHSNTKASITIN